jgi:pantetheine-phosphate adenylyltransferase
MSEVVAIYPGSFDPLTNGHVDIIQRGSRFFDRIVVGILINLEKAPLFTVPERVDIATVIVRGLRAISDFEYEMQMALMNRRLSPDVETVFMMPAEPYTYVSSRLVKEVVALGGTVTGLVPTLVEERLREKKMAGQTLKA